jgi:nitroreductase
MKEIMDYIYQRRSVRRYQDKKVDKDTMVLLLKAAMSAPSACNNQPWEFIAVTEEETMGRLRESLYFGKYNATAAIVVCGNMKFAKGGLERYWVQDCSAAMENILIAASGLGLGAVWIGVYPLPSVIEPLKKAMSIPEHVTPLGVAYIGYPAEEKEPRTQFNEKVVYWEAYDPDRKHKARPKNMKEL